MTGELTLPFKERRRRKKPSSSTFVYLLRFMQTELIIFRSFLPGEGRDRMATVARANEKQIFRPPGVSEVPEKEEVIAEPRYR